ncbi:MAG: AmmeMemoRadiSam system protein B [Candidatus Aenigmarchaeota archaeon]|nr:AmmeMemoRadiSam system protein B [Candidatus Aenigmarchaeota archaeon]NIP40103.1 AmmeMemoRadiSam system protein B [Candidatus Aenigmarchaeota archaeon]NIQ18180.1 AmmeMemoRadiSam system protein B [Candidatus Aenigmarchaeota archaeon]NIS72937.1 AmmeMemoRadiSam system protein B [Candidatus Aenigmarchaeota archaeon]
MIRRPVVAGMFYPQHEDNLKEQLSKLFEGIEKNDFLCVVSPHAGYEYSGRTAAYAINSLRSLGNFVILGPNHNLMGSKFSIMGSGEWETPLGTIGIDSELAKKILKCEVVQEDEIAHTHEHSIEVQLPFLQYRFKNFEIVPISISNIDYSEDFLNKCETLGKHIAKTIKRKKTGVVASSDFSHYLPAEVAKEKDEKAVERIRKLDPEGFFRTLEDIDASVCGYGPIAVLMYMAKSLGLKKVKILNHTDSGDTTGDNSAVVAYYAIGFK